MTGWHDVCGDRRIFVPHHGYRFSMDSSQGWRIGYGVSNFLVAKGSGWSLPLGRRLYRQLIEEARNPKRLNPPGDEVFLGVRISWGFEIPGRK